MEEQKEDFRDMTGDRVYDYLKTKVLDGHELMAAKIVRPKITGPKDAKVVLLTRVLDLKTKEITNYDHNYKKIERYLDKEGL